MTFAKKIIQTTITLGTGQFGTNPGSNSVSLTGYRTHVQIQVGMAQTQGTLSARIYGLPLSMMSQLTTIGPINTQIRYANKVQISIGDENSALTSIYTGSIEQAWVDMQDSPNIGLNIVAYTNSNSALLVLQPASFAGYQTVDTILRQIVININNANTGNGMTFVNNGVNMAIKDTYLPGSALDQIRAVIASAKCSYRIDQNILTIWPYGQASEDSGITISPDGSPGLVGYPTYASNGIIIKSEFAELYQGQLVTVKGSILEPANGQWIATNVVHCLESEVPNGQWFTQFLGVPVSKT